MCEYVSERWRKEKKRERNDKERTQIYNNVCESYGEIR
jgi:hypothetical protein